MAPGREMDHLIWRIAALVVILASADLWLAYHVGVGTDNTAVLSVAVMALMGAAKLVGKLPDPQQQKHVADSLRAFFRPVLWTPVLMVLAIIGLVVVLTLTSVTVVPRTEGTPVHACITPVTGKEATEFSTDGSGKLARALVATSPFGRPFRLEVDGYLPAIIRVYPIIGTVVRPSNDLRRSPSILFRPPWSVFSSLLNGGTIRILEGSSAPRKLIAEAGDYRGSFLLGDAKGIPTSLRSQWQLELAAANLRPKDAAATLLDWSQFKRLTLDPNVMLVPGATLEAEIRTRADKPVARVVVTVGNEELVDVPLLEVEDEPNDP